MYAEISAAVAKGAPALHAEQFCPARSLMMFLALRRPGRALLKPQVPFHPAEGVDRKGQIVGRQGG